MVRCLLLAAAPAVAACGGDSPIAPLTPPTAPTTPTAPPTGTLTATLSSIQRELFNPSCISHHGLNATEADLNLTEGESFASLVNVASAQVGLDRVEPGAAENSYLIRKLAGSDGIVGARMPPQGPFITDDALDVIRAWINDGAQNN